MGPSSSELSYFGFLLPVFIFLLIFELDPAFLTQAKLPLKSILPEQELQDQTLCHREGASSNCIFSHKSVKNPVNKATEFLPIPFSVNPPCPLLLWPCWSDMRSLKIHSFKNTRFWGKIFLMIMDFIWDIKILVLLS